MSSFNLHNTKSMWITLGGNVNWNWGSFTTPKKRIGMTKNSFNKTKRILTIIWWDKQYAENWNHLLELCMYVYMYIHTHTHI